MLILLQTGGKSATKATYIPNSYAKAQNTWIDSFYSSNGYLEVTSTLPTLFTALIALNVHLLFRRQLQIGRKFFYKEEPYSVPVCPCNQILFRMQKYIHCEERYSELL